MNFKTMLNSVGFFIKKNAPEILLTVGLLTAASSVVTACVATKRLTDRKIIGEANKRLDEIQGRLERKEVTVEQAKKEKVGVFTKTGWKLVKLYSFPIALFGVSSACLIGGNKVMASRNAALSAGFSALQSSYLAYRENVAKKLGKDVENEIYQDSVVKKADEDGLDTPKKDKSYSFDFIFDESCEQWEPDGRLNLNYLNTEENHFNRILQIKGYVTMYDILFGSHGFNLNPGQFSDEVISASHFFGWTRDGNRPGTDNYVSFGLYDKAGENTAGAINLQKYGEKNFFVQFNRPYYIYDRIPKLMKENR